MGRWVPCWGLFSFLVAFTACGTADNRVDPGDLELRDLLGISPKPASQWSAEQRTSARRVIAAGREEEAAERAADPTAERKLVSLPLAAYRDVLARDQVVMQALTRWDDRLSNEGRPAHVLVRVAVTPGLASLSVRTPGLAVSAATSAPVELQLAPGWSDEPLVELTDRGAGELAQLARDAGHASGPVTAVPAPRLAVLGAYVEGRGGEVARLLVNPVLLAALEPHSGDAIGALPSSTGGAAGGRDSIEPPRGGTPSGGEVAMGAGKEGGGAQVAPPIEASAIGGNPYSFYGSVAECAAAQRLRCQQCLPAGNCEAVTNISDGNAECEMLAANEGRGYFLQCINLSLAITAVEECTAAQAPACPRSPGAARSLSTLEANANFLDDDTCQPGLDRCLARIYGAPDGDFPGPGGGGGSPPRDIDVTCNNSCDDDTNNGNCESDPSCDCTGPSCNNSFSCDSTCSSSNDQDGCGDSGGNDSGCGGGCSGDEGEGSSGCDSDNGGGSGDDSAGCGGGDGGCGGDGSGGGGGCGGDGDSGGCGGDGSGGGCDSDCGGSGSGGGDCGGDGCGGGSGGGDGCGGGSGGGDGCGGGGKSSGCSVASTKPRQTSRPPAGLSFVLMGLWGLAPIPAAMIARRRARRARGEAPKPANDNALPSLPSTEAPADGATPEVTDDSPGETTDASSDAVTDAPSAPEEASASDAARDGQEVAR